MSHLSAAEFRVLWLERKVELQNARGDGLDRDLHFYSGVLCVYSGTPISTSQFQHWRIDPESLAALSNLSVLNSDVYG
jgi:hypothetical protein